MPLPPPRSTLFPYTTLFRSLDDPDEVTHARAPSLRQRLALGPVVASLKTRDEAVVDRKSTRLNSSHRCISYAVFCLKKKNKKNHTLRSPLYTLISAITAQPD